MNGDPRNIHSYAHAMLVEQVMALHGRASSDPKTYRRLLEQMGAPALQRALNESDFPALPEAPPVERIEANPCGSKLPARELTFP